MATVLIRLNIFAETRRSGAGARRKSEPLTSALNSEEDEEEEEEEEGGEPETNGFSASEDIEHDILFS